MSDARVAALHAELGITAAMLRARALRPHAEARRLQPLGIGTDGRDKLLAPAAAQAWQAMRAAAAGDGVELLLVSAFRGVEFQAALIRNKLGKGQSITEVLRVNAPPGYSEHHSGCAVDLGDAQTPPLDEAFERTAAFAWLGAQAWRYGFRMSYPRGNREGYLYEPWHWCWQGGAGSPLRLRR